MMLCVYAIGLAILLAPPPAVSSKSEHSEHYFIIVPVINLCEKYWLENTTCVILEDLVHTDLLFGGMNLTLDFASREHNPIG